MLRIQLQVRDLNWHANTWQQRRKTGPLPGIKTGLTVWHWQRWISWIALVLSLVTSRSFLCRVPVDQSLSFFYSRSTNRVSSLLQWNLPLPHRKREPSCYPGNCLILSFITTKIYNFLCTRSNFATFNCRTWAKC